MPRCDEVGAELDAYLDGELDEGRAGEIAAHLDACSSCSEELAERRKVSLALKRLPAVGAPQGFTARFSEARKAEPVPAAQPSRRGPSPFLWVSGSVAAAAAAVLLAVTVLPKRGEEKLSAPLPGGVPAAAKAKRQAPAPREVEGAAEESVKTNKKVILQDRPAGAKGKTAGEVRALATPEPVAKKVGAPLPRKTWSGPAAAIVEQPSTKSSSKPQAPSAAGTAPGAGGRQPDSKPKDNAATRAAVETKRLAGDVSAGKSSAVEVDKAKLRLEKQVRVLRARIAGGRKAKAESARFKTMSVGGPRPVRSPKRVTTRGTSLQDAESRLLRIASALGGGRLSEDADEKREDQYGGGKGGASGFVGAKGLSDPAKGGDVPPKGAATKSVPSSAKKPAALSGANARKERVSSGRRRLVLYLPADQVKTFEKALSYWRGKSVGLAEDSGRSRGDKRHEGAAVDHGKLKEQLEAAKGKKSGDLKKKPGEHFVILVIELDYAAEASSSEK